MILPASELKTRSAKNGCLHDPPNLSSRQAVILSEAEVIRLTGYKMPAKQIAFLKAKGIPFIINAKGRPVVYDLLNKLTPTRPELGPVP